MNKWIDCLCHVCGLREQDEVPDPAELVPPAEESSPAGQMVSVRSAGNSHSQARNSQEEFARPRSNSHVHREPLSIAAQSSCGGSYVKLDTCFSRTEDDVFPSSLDSYSIDTLSIPDIPPPPIPTLDDYDYPPKRSSAEDVYKVPPRSLGTDVYDVPPSREERHSDSSDFDNVVPIWKKDTESVLDFYDIPPPPVRTEKSGGMEAPPRPPKPGQQSNNEYINLAQEQARTWQPPRPPPRPSVDAIYDIPPKDNSILSMSPPAPVGTGGTGCTGGNVSSSKHSYVNTLSTADSRYMPMNRSSQEQPTYDILYTKMASPKKENGCSRLSGEGEEVYSVPPSNKPVGNMAPPPVSARPENTLTKYSKPIDNTCEVFSTSRTTSFRRAGMRQTPSPKPRISQSGSVPRDTGFGIGIPVRIGSSCSSSSDDDDSSLERSQSYANTSGCRRTTPPVQAAAQKSAQEAELQYLDLDPTSTPEKRPPKMTIVSASATEYKEIDFVKTNALCRAKKNLESEKERKNSDVCVLPPPYQH